MLYFLTKLIRIGVLPLSMLFLATFMAVGSDRVHSVYTDQTAGRRFTEAGGQTPGNDVPFPDETNTPKEADNPPLIVWWVLGVALLGLSGYLLFQIKKKQLLSEEVDVLRNELANLFDHAPCGYHAVDENGLFVSINKTLLDWLGYEREEVIGKLKFTEIVSKEHHDIVQDAIQNPNRNFDIDLMRKSGGAIPVLLRAAALHQRKGTLFSTVDNSECRQALDRIKNLDQELEAFSYSISHDLRAPLRSIDGYSKILQEDYAASLDDEGRRVLMVIMNNARRMGKLIDDLLDFGRLGRKILQPSTLNMTGIVHNIVAELLMKAPDRKIDVKVDELLPAFADADMMRQVWFNILDNAVKYTGKKEVTSIAVRSYRTGDDSICYEVKDNGEGFDMKYAPKLFGVFQRLHKMQDFDGTGVGLAIVKRIISRHGGEVWAEAELHQGATFYFTLPIENEDP